ncbi:hypothetical protein PENSPDRAFT_748935 [Peniophora sp. CONT]|nr:hypothetical protein PENSPDRAFT_748935 [Peniophora sp. CONT]
MHWSILATDDGVVGDMMQSEVGSRHGNGGGRAKGRDELSTYNRDYCLTLCLSVLAGVVLMSATIVRWHSRRRARPQPPSTTTIFLPPMNTFQATDFARAPSSFLNAIIAGPDHVIDFCREWSALVKGFQVAQAVGSLTPDAVEVVNASLQQIAVLASSLSETEQTADRLLCELLEGVTLEDVRSPSDTCLPGWLVLHLDNPYPSNEDVKSLADATSLSTDGVLDWLITARRSIGWETFVQQRYRGAQGAAMEAARCVYIEGQSMSVPADHVLELLCIKREAEKLRDQSVDGLFSEQGRDLSSLFLEDEEDTTPPPPVAGAKRRRVDEDDGEVAQKRVRVQRVFSAPLPISRQSTGQLRRNVSMPSVPASSTRCTFTMPSGQTLGVNALVAPSAPSRKRCAADDFNAVAPVPKRARASISDSSASLHGTQQSLSEILAAPTGEMLPSDIDSWASNIVPAADSSLDWMHSAFDALAPPPGEVSLTTVDWNDPSVFLGFDLTDYTVDAMPTSENVLAPFSVSTSTPSSPSSPRSVVESSSGSDTSLESLLPITGNDVAINGIFDDATFDWGKWSHVETQMPEPFVQEKVVIHDPLANFFDSLGQDPLTGLNFGEDPFGLNYGELCAPQFVLSY